MILRGTAISPGVARGAASVLESHMLLDDTMSTLPTLSPRDEIERFHAARGRATAQLQSVQRRLAALGSPCEAAIFSAHTSLVSDPSLTSRVEAMIADKQISAETAVARVTTEFENQFRSSNSSLLQEKAADILDVGQRLLRCLLGVTDLEVFEKGVIVSFSLTPTELVRAVHQGAIAAVTESCGMKSHTAILARGFAIPLVTGVVGVIQKISSGADVIVDGDEGVLIVNPESSEQSAVDSIMGKTRGAASPQPHKLDAITADGVRVKVLLNISDTVEAQAVSQLGADGVGLYRTEFLYLDRTDWPTEQESYQQYASVAAALQDRELNIRLADFGAEKCPSYADIPVNRNPSLGIRGVRFLLARDDVLQPQVKAIARLARERPITVLLPMVDTPDTLLAVTDRLVHHCRCRDRADLPFRISLMVEVPAAAFLIESMIRHVDEVSVGLNDLTQYCLAADRDDELVESYHDPLQPAVLRLVHQVIRTAGAQGKPVTMCGELAGDPMLARALLGLGARRFSVSRSHYHRTVSQLRRLDVTKETQLARRLLGVDIGQEIRRLLAEESDIS